MICLSRVAQLVPVVMLGMDVGITPDVINKCLLSIMQGHLRIEKNMTH